MGGCAGGGNTEFSALCAGRRFWLPPLSIEIMAGLGLKVTFRAPFFGTSSEGEGMRGEVSVVLVDAIVYQ